MLVCGIPCNVLRGSVKVRLASDGCGVARQGAHSEVAVKLCSITQEDAVMIDAQYGVSLGAVETEIICTRQWLSYNSFYSQNTLAHF